jgi:hypothetical protein
MELQEDQTNNQPGDSNVYDFGGADFLGDHGSLGEDAKVMLLRIALKSIRPIPFVRRVVDTWDVPEAVEEVDNSDEIPMPLLFTVFHA